MGPTSILPGINVPLSKAEEKQNKLAQTSEVKKHLLAAREPAPGMAGVGPDTLREEARILRDARQARRDQQEKIAREQASWASDTDLEDMTGQLLQKLAGVGTGTARLAGEGASLPFTAQFDNALAQVPDEHRALYAEEQQYKTQADSLKKARLGVDADLLTGKISDAEAAARRTALDAQQAALKGPDPQKLADLDQRPKQAEVPLFSPGNATAGIGDQEMQDYGLVQPAKSSRQRIEEAKQALGFATKIDKTIQGITEGIQNPLDKQRLDRDLSQTWQAQGDTFAAAGKAWDAGNKTEGVKQLAKGVAGLVAEGGMDLVSNPGAVFDYVAENVPQLALGAAGKSGEVLMAGSNLAYGGRIYRDAVEQYQVAHDGRLPSQGEAAEMLAWSLSASAAEQVMDASFLKALKGSTGEAVQEAVRKNGLKGLGEAAARVGQAGITGFAGEAATEAYQTAVENNLSQLDYSVEGEDVFKAAAIGGASGGVMKGSLQGLNEAGQVAGELQANLREQVEQARQQNEAQSRQDEVANAALESGDVSALADPSQPNYAPERAVKVLFERSQRADLDPEAKAQAQQQALEVVGGLEERLTFLKASQHQPDAQAVTVADQRIAHLQQQLDQLDPQASPEQAEQHELISTVLGEEQVRRQGLDTLEPVEVKRRALEILKLESQLASAQKMTTALTTQAPTAVDPAVLDQDVELLSTPVENPDAGHQEAARRVITLAMHRPGEISDAALERLASAPENALPPQHSAYLRTLRANRAAENAFKQLENVRTDVLDGDSEGKYIGINQYRQRLGVALQANQRSQAERQLAGINAFAADRAGKAQAMNEAWSEVLATGKPVQLVRDETSPTGFARADRRYSPADLKKVMGVEVNGNTGRLLKQVREEAQLAAGAAQEMKAAYQLAFPQTPANESIEPATEATPPAVTDVTSMHDNKNSLSPLQPGPVPETPAQAQPADAPEAEPQANAEEGREPASRPEDDTDAQLRAMFQRVNAEADAESAAAPAKPGLKALQRDTTLTGRYARQRSPKDEARKGNPLVQIDDFLSRWNDDPVLAEDMLGGMELNDAQSHLLRQLRETLNEWQGDFPAILVPPQAKDAGFRQLDLIQDFMDEQGRVEENLTTALGLAAYDGLADLAGSANLADDEWINSAVSRDAEAEVSDDLRALIAGVGVRESFLIEALGQKAVQALSLRFSDDAPMDLQPRLVQTLGMQSLRLLERRGLLERSTVLDHALAMAIDGSDGNPNLKHYFLKPAATLEVDALRRSLIGTQDLLGRLFGIEQGRIEPSFEPVPFTQQTAKRTGEALPEELVANISADQARARYIRQDNWSVLKQLDETTILEMAGAQHLEDHVHAANIKGLESANAALQRDWQAAREFIEYVEASDKSLEQPLYLQMFVARNHRVHYQGTVLNPQSSKIHRWLLSIDGWKTTIDVNDLAGFDNFRLRVLEGLGVAADKRPNQDTLANNWEQSVSRPVIRRAVMALRKAIYDQTDLAPAEQEAIRQGVFAGGEKFHSLDALVQLAHWTQAHREGRSTFEVTSMGEVDGKTNGAMLAMLNYGSALFDELNRGGFFEIGSPYRTFAEWRAAQGHLDLYESLMVLTSQAMGQLEPWQLKRLPAVYAITGELMAGDSVAKDGRDLTKNPLTVLFYGAGKGSVQEKMANGFIEKFYSQIEAISRNGQTKGKVKLPELLASANQLLAFAKAPQLNAGMDIDKAMKYQLSSEQVAGLKKAFVSLVAKPLNSAVEEKFARHLHIKDGLVEASNVMFGLFDGVYQAQRKRLIQTLDLPKNGAGQPLHDLSTKQEQLLLKRLGKLRPLLPLALSQGKGAAGLFMAKRGKQRANSADYFSEVRYFEEGRISKRGLYGQKLQYLEPGVSPLALSTQSMDSRISSQSYAAKPALNVHDANGFGYGDMAEGARNLNAATYHSMLDYSTPTEMFNALEAQLTQLARMLKSKTVDAGLKEDVLRSLQALYSQLQANMSEAGDKGPVSLPDLVERLDSVRQQAAQVKFANLAQMAVVDQYPFEGGTYAVTDADRKEATQRLRAELERDTTEVKAHAAYLDALLGEASRAEMNTELAKARWRAEHLPATGLPTARSDAGLVELLQHGSTAGAVFEYLERSFMARGTKGDDLRGFSAKLLKAVRKQVPEDLPIHYVHAGATDLQADRSMANALAWYHVTAEGQASISLWGQDFVTSTITPQVLLHELVHAALADVVDRQATPEVRELTAELERLRSQAKAVITGNAELASLAPAVENVQEFLAWGLTNPDFQLKVLTRTQLDSQTGGNRLRTLWHKFVETLAGLLTGRRQPDEAWGNGLSLFLANSLPLFSAAHEANSQARQAVTLAHAASDEVLDLSARQILAGLPDSPNRPLSAAFRQHLDSLLTGFVDQLHGPFGAFAQQLRKSQALSMSDVLFKALDRGELPFASEALAGPFLISEPEAFVLEQVEVTVAAVLEGREGLVSPAFRQLERLFGEARRRLTAKDFHAGDWTQATAAERAQARQRWDFLFELPAGINGKSRHLSRFAALALAHEPTQALLRFNTSSQQEAVTGTLLEKLVHWFNNLLTTLGQKLTHTFDGQRADLKLEALVEKLVDIEAKRRRRLAAVPNRALQMVEESGRFLADSIRAAADKAGQSALLKNSRNSLARAAGTTLGVWANDRMGDMAEVALRVRNQQLQKPLGVVAHLVQDFRGATDKTQVFFRLLAERKDLEKQRQEKISHTRELVLKQFRDSGATLTLEQKKALSQLLRADLGSLLDHYSEAQLGQLLEDPRALEQAIVQERRLLAGSTHRHAYDKAAKNLGFFLVSNQVRSEHLMLNAGNIVRRLGTGSQVSNEDALATYTPVVDRLTTLYALQYSSAVTLQQARELWRSERQNQAGNGLVGMLKLHRELLDQSRQSLFQGSEALMMKGYLPEITDPHREVLAALPEEEEQLQRLGYSAGEMLPVDALDPNPQQRRLYVHTSKGLRPYLSAVMGYTAKKTKGSQRKRYGAEVDATVLQADRQELMRIRREKEALMARENQPDPGYDPRKVRDRGAKLVPVVNPDGVVVNYRYLMSAANRDTLLDRDNRFENLLGQLAGSSFDKETNPQHNRTVIDTLHQQFKEQYAEKPESFAVVGLHSKNPELREIWRMLPAETQQAVKEIWGQDYLQVPYEQLDLLFGYRKPSLATSFEKEESEWTTLEQLIVPMLEAVYPGIGIRLRQAEDIWKEIVGLVKNIWVVRSLVTILGNIKSNLTLLIAYGVSPGDLVRNHLIAFKGAWSYRQDYKAREQLQLLLDSGLVMGSTQEMEQEIRRLNDRLARNPVRELIEGGLLPSIVEDVQDVNDPYSYQSKLGQKVEGIVERIPPALVTAGKWLVMAKDTPIYGLFNQTVQLSDFMGRYTLYQHLISRPTDSLSQVDAMDRAREAFVQYDIPLHRFLTYLDEMGIVPFLRFYIRIQKIIFQLFREQPARMISMALLGQFFNTSSLITDASMWHRLGNNPLSAGALNLPGSLDDIATMKLALDLLPGK